jgi:hypothetical protein
MRVSLIKTILCLSVIMLFALVADVAQASPTTDSVAFQGRLTDASDNAVSDGPRDLTLSLWTDSIGGTMIYSEVRTVTTSKGLYSTCLGCGSSAFVDAMQSGDLWLQTQLAGQAPMVPRTRLRNVPRAITSSGVYGEASAGQSRAKGIITVKTSGSSGTSALTRMADDVNNDAINDITAEMEATGDSASLRLNGLPPGTPYIGNFAVSASGGGAHSTLSGHNGSTTGTIRMAATPDSVVTTDGCGSDGEQRLFCTADSVVREITFTDNSPGGTNLMKAKEKANRTKCSNNLRQTGMTVSHEIDQSCDLTGATFKAIQTKGTGQSGMVRMDASDSAGISSTYDVDGNGIADFSAGGVTNDSSSRWSVSAQADDGGNHTDGWNVGASKTETRETLKTYFETGDIPTQDQVVNASGSTFRAINTKGTGATVRVAMEATDSASTVVATDADGDGHADSRANIAATMNGNVVIGCLRDKNNDGVADVSAVTEVTGDSATFRLNGLPPGVFPSETVAMTASSGGVHMEVGAATCDGSTWTNASDRNLKENFTPVDGAELLEKIDELPIQQWNYKSQSSEVVHIGPTAQDFKSLFGVGESDKTISTIDPSGIALAAIKQLNKQNHELQEQTLTLANQNKALLEQNALLKKQLDAIAAKVEWLTSGK